MSVFLWVILIFVGFYYVSILFLRYVLPWLLTRFIRKQQEKFSGTTGQRRKSPDGEVKVNTNQRSSSKGDDGTFGEYIDFEEIEDNPNS